MYPFAQTLEISTDDDESLQGLCTKRAFFEHFTRKTSGFMDSTKTEFAAMKENGKMNGSKQRGASIERTFEDGIRRVRQCFPFYFPFGNIFTVSVRTIPISIVHASLLKHRTFTRGKSVAVAQIRDQICSHARARVKIRPKSTLTHALLSYVSAIVQRA